MKPLSITNYTLTTALGVGKAKNLAGLQTETTGLAPCQFLDVNDLPCWIGEVEGLDSFALPNEWSHFECRNNRLAYLALQQDGFQQAVAAAVDRYGAERIACYIGTSTSGIHQTELAYIERQQQHMQQLPTWYDYQGSHLTSSVALFVQQLLGLTGPCLAMSTACSSSAKVFACAERAIRAGLCDAAVVGGVDSLCLTTLYGFNSLQLVDSEICKPSDKNRNGLNIGEAGGFALLQRDRDDVSIKLLGYGESSDAHHMSAPHPEGLGAVLSMRQALASAELTADAIDYINLHGTGTRSNDLSESTAVNSVFGSNTPASSTKGWTGHTLGAAGIIEAIFAIQAIEQNWVPRTLNTNEIDAAISINVLQQSQALSVNNVLSNSFGFGGSNCSLIFGGDQA